MKLHWLTVWMIGCLPLWAASITGYVADRESGETIIGVNVLVDGTDLGASTDRNGFFRLNGLKTGDYTLKFDHIAYQPEERRIRVAGSDLYLGTITIATGTVELEAITVTANRGQIVEHDMDISGFEVDPVVLREVPTMGRDVFKLIQYTPSVNISDPLSPLYYVRGSDPGENLVLLDGMTIYNPQHILSLQALFNPYSIKNIEMLVGGFDAEYGGRNSSILYISSREGHQDEVKGEFKPSTSGFKGAIEFPVRNFGTAMVSGRAFTSLLNRVMMNMPNYMSDFNGAWQHTIGKTRLRFSFFTARDYMDYDFSRFAIYFPQQYMKDYSFGYEIRTSNFASGLKTRTVLSPDLIAETQVYYSRFSVKNINFYSFLFEDTVNHVDYTYEYRTKVENSVADGTGKLDLTWFTFFNQTVKAGAEISSYEFFNEVGDYGSTSYSGNRSSQLSALYLQDKIDLKLLLVKFGCRTTSFDSGRWRLEPRASTALEIGAATLKFAWGKYHQYVAAMNTQDFELVQYLDYYYPLRNLAPMTSEHFIFSIESRLSKSLGGSFAAYYKDMPILYRFDYNTSTGSIFAYNASLERGSGEAYGMEFLLRGDWKRWSGWLSYTWSHATRSFPSIQNGDDYLYDGDQPHSVKSVLLLKITDVITASSTLKITSGSPHTWEVGNYNYYTYDPVDNTVGLWEEEYTPVKNNVRYPTRIRWDIGWKKLLRRGFGYNLAEYIGSDKAYFTLSIQNLLFLHRDPLYYFYFPGYGYYGFTAEYFPAVSAGYSIEF